jgi:hypothetical protein
MKIGEVFHNDGVKCSFQIVDGTNYLCYITENEDKSNDKEQKPQLFHSDTKSFVEIQQYLFDNLCNKAISAREKIKEIERGIRRDFTDTISEPAEIRKIVINQIMSAKDEILLLFSTSNSFHRAKYGGMLNLLRQIPNDVTVKVLIQAGDNLERDAIQEELRESIKQIRVQYITKPLQTNIVALVVDQSTSVAIEISEQNIIAYIEEKMDKKEVFDYKTKGLMASIGKRTGVGNLMGIQVHGFLAWWIWRNYYLANLPTLHKKIRVLVDWIIDIFFRRDVTMLKTLAEIKRE